jgi:hypothetical protein
MRCAPLPHLQPAPVHRIKINYFQMTLKVQQQYNYRKAKWLQALAMLKAVT